MRIITYTKTNLRLIDKCPFGKNACVASFACADCEYYRGHEREMYAIRCEHP